MVVVSMILLQVIIFGGLIFLLRHLLTRNVTDATSHMQGMIKGYSEKEDQIKIKLEEAEKYYAEKIKNADKEIEKLKDECKKQIDEEKVQVLAQAHKESETVINKARLTCEAIENELESKINQRGIEKAGELICQVLSPELCQIIHTTWVESLIESGFATMEWLKVPEAVNVAKVSTAFALTKTQKETLQKKLDIKLEREIKIEEKVSEKLVAGMIINLGSLVLDGSFVSKIREVVRESTADES
ncbi:MAG: F0F1 ATP synthase subunit delta [Candidatus Omnitrophota bacterium]